MRLTNFLPVFTALVLGGVLALLTAVLAVNIVESRAQHDVTHLLTLNGYDWAKVEADGLQVILSGTAPDEATRFKALSLAGTLVDTSRINDRMNVADRAPINPPRFSVEILRNKDGISLIGLIPASMDRETVVSSIRDIAAGAPVTDLLDVADYPAPKGWDTAISYGLGVLAELPRSKISIAAGQVKVVAMSDSAAEKQRIESDLARHAPSGLKVALEISAPRPVITPFTLRFLIDEKGARFDACSTDTIAGREKILAAARTAGLTGKATCTIGLGIPSPHWDDAVVEAIKKLAALGKGSVTFSDADVTFVAPAGTPQAKFDEIAGALEAELPDIFSLHASIAEPVKIDGTGKNDSGPPEFIATLSPEGLVHLSGRVLDERTRAATEAFAKAKFGTEAVNGSMRIDESLPRGWSTRVLVSLQALSLLKNGSVVTQPGFVQVKGVTGNPDAKATISRILSDKLGDSENYSIAITYKKALDPVANLPSPQECVDKINAVLKEQKVTFSPSSADIDREGLKAIDRIADIMKDCTEVPMEVGVSVLLPGGPGG